MSSDSHFVTNTFLISIGKPSAWKAMAPWLVERVLPWLVTTPLTVTVIFVSVHMTFMVFHSPRGFSFGSAVRSQRLPLLGLSPAAFRVSPMHQKSPALPCSSWASNDFGQAPGGLGVETWTRTPLLFFSVLGCQRHSRLSV